MRRTIILAAALSIILLGLWGTAVIYFDEVRLKGIVSDRLSEQVGRRVEIVGALRFSLFPRPGVEAEDIIIAGPGGNASQAMMRAQRVSMSLRFLPLLQGELAPGQMQLSGAVINLGRRDTGGGVTDPLAAVRSSARLLSGRSLRLEDVTLVWPGSDQEPPRSIAIDYIELDRFSLDRTVSFRFRGDLGEPPVLDGVSVDGMLHVPASEDSPVRLRDIRLEGRLAALDRAVSLTGDLTATRDDPFRLALAGGRLRLGGSTYDLSFNYHGGERPAADLLLSGPQLDWLATRAFPAQSMNVDLAATLAAVSAKVDLRSQLQFNRLRIGPTVFSDARIDLRSQSAGLGVNLAAVFPGGLAEASGVLTTQGPQSLAIDASLAEFGEVLEWLGQPGVVDGSGEARLSLTWPLDGVSGYELEGGFELWNGHWRVAREDSDAARRPFDRLGGDIRLTPGYLEIPSFELIGSELSGGGWAAVDLPEGSVGGELRIGSGPQESWLALSGSLAQPRLAPLTPATSGPEGEPVTEGEEQGQ